MAIVTISRGTFSGGKAVAEHLAAQLGYPCVSSEVLLDAAKEYGIPEAKLMAALKEPPHFWEQVPAKRTSYLSFITAAIVARAASGNLVYHGYAGHFLLRGITHVLRARIIADMEFRIKAAMEQGKRTREQALAFIARVDKERTQWTRMLYGAEWQDPFHYDVVINLEHLGVAGAVETLAKMLAMDHFKPTAASRQSFENLVLSSKVWAALFKDARTKAAQVRVTSDQGKVMITGNAGSGRVLEAIPQVVAQVEGVGQVQNDVGIGQDWYW